MWTVQNCRDCLEVGNMCCEDAELQGSVTGSVAKIARWASTPHSQGRTPTRTRASTRGLCLSRSPNMTRKIFSSTIEQFLVLI